MKATATLGACKDISAIGSLLSEVILHLYSVKYTFAGLKTHVAARLPVAT